MRLQIKQNMKNEQLLYLLFGGGTVFLFVFIDAFFPGIGYFLAEKLLAVPCLMFLGFALARKLTTSAKISLLLSLAAVIWFAVVQMQHKLSGVNPRSFGIFAFVYLLGFPYAAVTEDGNKNVGLKWIGISYVVSSLISMIFVAMLLLDAVPENLAYTVFWDGARVNALWHPNRLACVFMIAIGFSLYFLFCAQKRWQKILLAVLIALHFGAIVLTNSRMSILLTCCLFGGTLFFRIWKGSLKQFLAGAAAALITIVMLFSLSGNLFEWHTQKQINRLMEQAETSEEASQRLNVDEKTGEVSLAGASMQGELKEDLKTLNSRTIIWDAAFRAMEDNPVIKTWGTEYLNVEISSRLYFTVGHAHNSWIQVWMLLGTPAFLIAMMYTLIAVVNLLWLMWRKNVDLSKKVMAMLVLCLLGVSFLESYLFAGEMPTSFVNFAFFFCTGYLVQWNTDAKAAA